jgi:hypothetical protein
MLGPDFDSNSVCGGEAAETGPVTLRFKGAAPMPSVTTDVPPSWPSRVGGPRLESRRQLTWPEPQQYSLCIHKCAHTEEHRVLRLRRT